MHGLSEAIRARWGVQDRADWLLPPLLLLLTAVTGLVDAASYLNLGHVFVANMTGNVVFLGFAIAGAGGLSGWASLTAVGSFLAGAVAGGRIGVHFADRHELVLRAALVLQALAVTTAAVLAAVGGDPITGARQFALIVVLAFAMGVQAAAARRLAVPDLATIIVTMTLTGLAADSRLAGGPDAQLARRVLAVGAMLVGALLGALLALRVATVATLGTAAAVLAVTAVAAHQRTVRVGR